jgi:hypothetical protein
MTPHPIVRPVGSIIGSEKDFSGILPGEVPCAHRDGSEKFPSSERSATFHIPYHDVSR